MKTAVLYDIHGNLPALEAVISEFDDLDIKQVVIGGDVVLGPMTNECLDLLFSIAMPTHFIKGNCESEVLSCLNGRPNKELPAKVLNNINWTARQMQERHIQDINNWPDTITLQVQGMGNVFFCHATPESNTENFTRLTVKSKIEQMFGLVQESYTVCGHTHMHFEISIANTTILNAGSVGMPFGEPGAYWLTLGDKIEFRHTPYDYKHASSRVLNSAYPDAEDFAKNNILNPPSEESILKWLT